MKQVVRRVHPVEPSAQPDLYSRVKELFPRISQATRENAYYLLAAMFISDALIAPNSRDSYPEDHPYFTRDNAEAAQALLAREELLHKQNAEDGEPAMLHSTPWLVEKLGDVIVAEPPQPKGAVLFDRHPWRDAWSQGLVSQADLRNAERHLEQVNAYLGGVRLGLTAPFESKYDKPYKIRLASPWTHAELMPRSIVLSRLFNAEGHGRFYQRDALAYWVQRKKVRKHITIDGEMSLELDYQANHIAVLCGLMGKGNPHEDPYMIVCEKLGLLAEYRDHVKRFAIIGINSQDEKRFSKNQGAFNARHDRYMLGLKEVKPVQVRRAFLELYPGVEEMVSREGMANRIMYEESCVMADVLIRAIKADIAIAPIHDCVMCAKSDAQRVHDIMASAFAARFPTVTPRIKGYLTSIAQPVVEQVSAPAAKLHPYVAKDDRKNQLSLL